MFDAILNVSTHRQTCLSCHLECHLTKLNKTFVTEIVLIEKMVELLIKRYTPMMN